MVYKYIKPINILKEFDAKDILNGTQRSENIYKKRKKKEKKIERIVIDYGFFE